jgi:hypothetical protein
MKQRDLFGQTGNNRRTGVRGFIVATKSGNSDGAKETRKMDAE